MTPEAARQAGWSIIPTGLDKRPLIPTWKPFQTRLATAEEYSAWARLKAPSWAVITGPLSRRITLDADGEAGRETFAKLGLKPHRKSPSGGFHADFVHP